ncbi:MAG TPA: hypothetical protein VI113_11235 [Alphaproteobacteria bacterium]
MQLTSRHIAPPPVCSKRGCSLSAAYHYAAERFHHLFEVRNLGSSIVELLCSEPTRIGTSVVEGVIGEVEERPDVVEAEAKLPRATNEAQPLCVRAAVDEVKPV